MFMDETMQSFFRRCTFSPDGSFLFLPGLKFFSSLSLSLSLCNSTLILFLILSNLKAPINTHYLFLCNSNLLCWVLSIRETLYCNYTNNVIISFLLLAGLIDGEKKPRKTSYIFARGHYSRYLGSHV